MEETRVDTKQGDFSSTKIYIRKFFSMKLVATISVQHKSLTQWASWGFFEALSSWSKNWNLTCFCFLFVCFSQQIVSLFTGERTQVVQLGKKGNLESFATILIKRSMPTSQPALPGARRRASFKRLENWENLKKIQRSMPLVPVSTYYSTENVQILVERSIPASQHCQVRKKSKFPNIAKQRKV